MLAQLTPERSPVEHLTLLAERLFQQAFDKSDGRSLRELEGSILASVMELGLALLGAVMGSIGLKEADLAVEGEDGKPRTVKRLLSRQVTTRLGDVEFWRFGYGGRGQMSLFPADAWLNLPPEKYSHEVRRLVALEVAQLPYEQAQDHLHEYTQAHVPRRQMLELASRAAQDFEGFYEARNATPDVEVATKVLESKEEGVNAETPSPLLVLTTDGKGVVMRQDSLRKATKRAAASKRHKLEKRLSRGEKKNRKRMAQVASVYEIKPWVRSALDVMGELSGTGEKPLEKRPRPQNKRVWASVERSARRVVEELFAEGLRRDPNRHRQWVVLVDGGQTQLSDVNKQAKLHGVVPVVVLDVIHVTEYLWKSAWAFFALGDPHAQEFVDARLKRLLQGESSQVAKGIRRMATMRKLTKGARVPVDKCANYLLKYRAYLHYDEYLAKGLPIATGVIEGACRHLIKDRMDVTGARWGLTGAEAILKLRSLRSSGDFEAYWTYHEAQELARNHRSRYALPSGQLPTPLQPVAVKRPLYLTESKHLEEPLEASTPVEGKRPLRLVASGGLIIW